MNAIIKKITLLSLVFCVAVLLSDRAFAMNDEETEAATESQLLQIMLPANAQRVLPQSVPVEIKQTLTKIATSENAGIRQGESEVLLWGGSGYNKNKASGIINNLTGNLKSAGWNFSVAGQEDGVTVFTALKEGAPRRGVVGFYGASDEVLIFAASEVLTNGAAADNSVSNNSQIEQATVTQKTGNGGAGVSQLVGNWYNGNVSMLQEKNLITGQINSSNASRFAYKFFADGRFEYIGYMKSTMYGCTTDLFNDKRGKVEISGNQITFVPTKNYWKNTYSCSPSSNKERDYTLDRETYTFRTETNKYGKEQICLANSKGESCYEREK